MNFVSSKDTDEEDKMHSMSYNTDWIMTKRMKLLKNFLKYFLIDIKLGLKHH